MQTAAALWRISPELVLAMDADLGLPVDSYVNGSQTWFTGEPVLEWRLHPVRGYQPPPGLSPYDLWEIVVGSLERDNDPTAIPLGSEARALTDLWDGLECFPAYGDELEPATLAERVREVLTIAPAACGLVDHEVVGNEWERTQGAISIVSLLGEQLGLTAR